MRPHDGHESAEHAERHAVRRCRRDVRAIAVDRCRPEHHWSDEIDRTGYGQEHDLALTNGSENMGYRLSLGYQKQNAIRASPSIGSLDQLRAVAVQRPPERQHQRAWCAPVDRFTPGDVLATPSAWRRPNPCSMPRARPGIGLAHDQRVAEQPCRQPAR
jgi:hypothetical protein